MQESHKNPAPFDLGSLNRKITQESVDFTNNPTLPSRDITMSSKSILHRGEDTRPVLRENSKEEAFNSDIQQNIFDGPEFYEESKNNLPLQEKSEINNTHFTVTSIQSNHRNKQHLRKNGTRKYFERLEKEDLKQKIKPETSKKSQLKEKKLKEKIRRHNSTAVIQQNIGGDYNVKKLNTNKSSALLLGQIKNNLVSRTNQVNQKNEQFPRNYERTSHSIFPENKSEISKTDNKENRDNSCFSKKSSELTFTKKSIPSQAQPACFYDPSKAKCNDHDIRLLGDFLIDLILDFRQLEEVKQKLSVRPDFNMNDFFKLINEDKTGEINPEDLLGLLQSVDIRSDIQEALMIIERFDKSRNGKLNFGEFSKIILPFEVEYKKRVLDRGKRGIKTIKHYSDQTLGLIKLLLEVLIQNEKNCDFHREMINRKKDLLFDTIDIEKKGSVEKNELKIFLSLFDFKFNDFDLEYIVYKFDWKENGKISYGEFVNEVTPKKFKIPKAKIRDNLW